MALPQQTDPLPPAQLTRTQQRFVPVLLDPATRHLPVLELAQLAGLSSEASWFVALCDEPFRAWVEQLGRRCPPPHPSVADALAGRIPIEEGLSPAQQRFWHLLQDPAHRQLPRRDLCRKAGYTTDGPWYEAVRDPTFRAWVRSLGIKCTMAPKRALRLDRGPIPLAEDIDAEWALDRIDIRRITSDYPKHKNGGSYTIDFSFIQHPDLKALIKRYFRARVGYWTGTTMVSTLPTLKPIIQELERRYPGLSSFASLTREMFEPVLAMTGWVDSMERYHEMTAERRLRTAILLQAMFTYMQRHQWPEAPQQALMYDEDFPQRIRHKPRPIPETVMEQLLAHIDRLPPYDQHLVQIMSVMGLRSVDALHLNEDCLEYDATGDPRVRWYNVKMKREVRPLPVSREVEAAILAQRELVKDIPVNARVNLRRNNFDPPVIFVPTLTLSRVLSSVCSAPERITDATPHPAAGRLHLDTLWETAGAETSERGIHRRAFRARSSRLPSLPQVSRSYALPPPCLNSLTPDAHRAGPPRPRLHRFCPSQRRPPLRQLPFDPLLSWQARLPGDLSCGNWGPKWK